MTNEERNIISQFIARVGGAQASSGFAGSVPATTQPALPPVDREADALIAEQFQRYPEARYRITQLAFVQEQALMEAQNRIQRLQWELQQAQQAAQQAQQQQAQQRSGGGFLGGLFGGGRQSAPPPPPPGGPWGQGGPGPQQGGYYQQPQYAPPPPQYPPTYQPGVFQRGGSGFLGSALTTAAGVAGGMLAANAITSLFSGHHSYGGFGGGAPMESPWGGSSGAVESGSWGSGGGEALPASNQDYVDNGSWDQPTPDQAGWTDNSGGGGWTDNSSGGGGWDDNSGGGWDNSSGGSDDDTF